MSATSVCARGDEGGAVRPGDREARSVVRVRGRDPRLADVGVQTHGDRHGRRADCQHLWPRRCLWALFIHPAVSLRIGAVAPRGARGGSPVARCSNREAPRTALLSRRTALIEAQRKHGRCGTGTRMAPSSGLVLIAWVYVTKDLHRPSPSSFVSRGALFGPTALCGVGVSAACSLLGTRRRGIFALANPPATCSSSHSLSEGAGGTVTARLSTAARVERPG